MERIMHTYYSTFHVIWLTSAMFLCRMLRTKTSHSGSLCPQPVGPRRDHLWPTAAQSTDSHVPALHVFRQKQPGWEWERIEYWEILARVRHQLQFGYPVGCSSLQLCSHWSQTHESFLLVTRFTYLPSYLSNMRASQHSYIRDYAVTDIYSAD